MLRANKSRTENGPSQSRETVRIAYLTLDDFNSIAARITSRAGHM